MEGVPSASNSLLTCSAQGHSDVDGECLHSAATLDYYSYTEHCKEQAVLMGRKGCEWRQSRSEALYFDKYNNRNSQFVLCSQYTGKENRNEIGGNLWVARAHGFRFKTLMCAQGVLILAVNRGLYWATDLIFITVE